jgi:hypothetical protein
MNTKKRIRILFFLGLFGYILAFFSCPLFFILFFFVSSALIFIAALYIFLLFVKRSKQHKLLAAAALCIIILYGTGEVIYPYLFKKIDLSGRNAAHRSLVLEQFKSLPYVSWSKNEADARVRGVTKYDLKAAFPGYNLYADNARYAYLMDMAGNIVYRWQFPIQGRWAYAELLDDGSIVAVCTEKCVAKIDRNSNIIWVKNIRAHHDIAILPDGGYLIPVAEPEVGYRSHLIKFDAVVRLSADGEILGKWSTRDELPALKKLHDPLPVDLRVYRLSTALRELYLFIKKNYTFTNAFRRNVIARFGRPHRWNNDATIMKEPAFSERMVTKIRKNVEKIVGLNVSYDYYHLNSIEVLPKTALGMRDARFQQGNHLICLRNANLILILDKDTKKVVWHWGPRMLDWPHMPTLLENGNILVYDNGEHRSYSRIVELNPMSESIEWEYRASPPEMFYSQVLGSNQRLPNGNTLICESKNGRAFEVTRDKEIVWEFYNPEIKKGKRKSIYRMMRITDKNKLRSLLF